MIVFILSSVMICISYRLGWDRVIVLRGLKRMSVQEIVKLYVEVMQEAIPFAVVFWMGNLIVSTFCRAAFGGRLEFRV